MPTASRTRLAACLGLACLLSPTVLAAQAPSRQQIEQRLQPAYEQVKNDVAFQALARQLESPSADRAMLDRALRMMPLSPLEYHRLDMKSRRYEFGIPKFMVEWHRRWIELNRDLAEEIYGAPYVENALDENAATVDDGNRAFIIDSASVGTNRNSAAASSPAPEEYQGEVQVVVNPNDPSQIVSAANTWDDLPQSAFYSSDGGITWGHSGPPPGTAYGLGSCGGFSSEFGSDPALYWDDAGNVYLEYMALCSGIVSTQFAVVVARSTNGGASWSTQGVIINSWGNSNVEDKEFYIVDNHPGSPFSGRHYTCWDRNNDERFAYSTDAGASWTEVDLPDVAIDLGCEMAVADDGTVHLIWDTLNCGASCSNERMFYTRSTNGGVSWSAPVLVRDFNLVGFSGNNCPDAQDDRCIGPFGSIDIDNSGGVCDGTLYATFTDHGAGEDVNDSDVFVSRSTNNGSTWATPVKVNDDGLANRAQFHPFLVVDPANGHVVVGWHDARNDPGNDAVDYFVARSTDCGVGFEANIQVSQPSTEFNNSTITYSNQNTADNPSSNPNQYGEYMGVDALNGRAYLAWSDTRHFFPSFGSESQQENVGFATVDFEAGPECGNGVLETGEECDGSELGGAACSDMGCSAGTVSCTASCTLDYSGCTSCGGPVCGNGTCELGEDCASCAADCITGSGATCGNGVCEAGAGEDCLSCAVDCNGVQTGKPSNRFCCGDGDGQNPIGCSDARCTAGGASCTEDPLAPSCCGDATCEGIEDPFNCSLDCGAPPTCGDGTCDPGEDQCSCALDCGSPPGSEVGLCGDSVDNDCDLFADCDDTADCGGDPLCDTSCQPKNAACTLDEECCSLQCKPNGRCR